MIPREFNRTAVEAILSGTFTRSDANAMGLLCKVLAVAAIRHRQSPDRTKGRVSVLTEEDVLQESFIQLFRRDGGGRFTEIERYFYRYLPEATAASDERIIQTLRGLVTAKVSNGIICVYAKSDPALSRILRNLKLTLKHSRLFETMHRYGEEYVCLRGVSHMPHLECIPIDCVRSGLSESACSSDRTPDMLRKLHAVLTREKGYQPTVPMVPLALALREAYAGAPDAGGIISLQDENDIPALVEGLCHRLQTHWHPRYVGSGKMCEEEFGAMFGALGSALLEPGCNGESYFEHLRHHLPTLTRERYLERYRTALEYFAKTAKRELRREFGR
jgi:hypothetical protein